MTQADHHEDADEVDPEAFKAMIRNSVKEGENNLHRSQDFVGSQALSPRSSHGSPRKPKAAALYKERPSEWLGSPSKRKSYRVKTVATKLGAPDLDGSSFHSPETAPPLSKKEVSPEKEEKSAPKLLVFEEEEAPLNDEGGKKVSQDGDAVDPSPRRKYVAVEAQPVKSTAMPLKAKHATAGTTRHSMGASSSHHDSSTAIPFNSEHSLPDVEYYRRVIRECNQIDQSPLQRSQEFLGGSQHSLSNNSFHTARECHGRSPFASPNHRPSDWMGSPSRRRTYKIKAIPNLDDDGDAPISSKSAKAKPPTGMTKHSLGASSSHHSSGFAIDSGSFHDDATTDQESMQRSGHSCNSMKSSTDGCLRRSRHSPISSDRPTDWFGSPSSTKARSYVIKGSTTADNAVPDLERLTITSQPSSSSKGSTISDMETPRSDTKASTKSRVAGVMTRHTLGASASLHETSSFANSNHSTTNSMPDPEKYKQMIRHSMHSEDRSTDFLGGSDHSLNHESFHSARDFFSKSSHNSSAGRPMDWLGSPPSARKSHTTVKKISAHISPVPKLDALTDDSDNVDDCEAELTPGRRTRNGRSQSLSLGSKSPKSAKRASAVATTQPIKSQSMATDTRAPYVSPVSGKERVDRNKFLAAMSAFEVSK